MNIKRFSKSILCLALACFLVFNIVTIPARATGALAVIEGIATVLGPVGTVAAVSVIALGLWAGANPDDFDNIVDGVSAHLSEIGTNMKDGFVQMLQVTDSAGAKQLYVAAETLENVRSWLFDSNIVTPTSGIRTFVPQGSVYKTYTMGSDAVILRWCSYSNYSTTRLKYELCEIVVSLVPDYKYVTGSQANSTVTSGGNTYWYKSIVNQSGYIDNNTISINEWLSGTAAGYTYIPGSPSIQDVFAGYGFSEYLSDYDVSIGTLSNFAIVNDVSVYDSTWNANQLRVAVADPENNEPEYKVYFPVPLPSNYDDLHSATQSDVITGSLTGVPDLGEDEKYVIEELPIVDGYQGVLVSPSDTQSGTQSGTTTGAVTLPGWVQDGFNNLKDGLNDLLDSLKNLPSALWALIPAWIQEGLSNMVVGLRDILDAIKVLPGAIAEVMADVITGALTKAFAISDTFVATKVEALTLKYPYLDTFLALGADLKAFFLGLGTTPPVIYINLGASEGSYNIGGQEIFMDLSWYARYKPTMDAVIGGFIWLWLAWRVYLAIPGIISGASGVWGTYNIQHERNLRAEEREQRQQYYTSRRKKE